MAWLTWMRHLSCGWSAAMTVTAVRRWSRRWRAVTVAPGRVLAWQWGQVVGLVAVCALDECVAADEVAAGANCR